MSGRQCAKEELCCRKAKAMIEAHEANLSDNNYSDSDDPEKLRKKIRDKIDRFATWLENEILEYIQDV